MDKSTQKTILDSNRKTDKTVINSFDKLAEELEKLGVDMKPKYTLSAPLDSSKTQPKVNSKTRCSK
jgi:hypothetical protein